METSIIRVGCALAVVFATWAVAAPNKPAAPPKDLRAAAMELLIRAANGPDPGMRSNAIEALQSDPRRALPLTDKGLADENPGVRFAAAVTAGMLKLRELNSQLGALLDDPNPSVRAASLYALHVLGEKVDITPLADMLAASDPGLRGNVALLMGLMGDSSAIPMLKQSASLNLPRAGEAQKAVVRVQIAEAVARLGDDSALDALRAGIFSQYHEVRVLAITATGTVGDRAMEVALVRLVTDPGILRPRDVDPEVGAMIDRSRAEVQLAAAGALARLGNMKGVETAQQLSASTDPMVRAHACWAMGWMKDDATLRRLDELMEDSAAPVQLAAAAAVVRRTR